ncbi:MAG: NADH-quinone oxidoreductase subunit NuoK [Chloroflexota bacterium]|nr:NADH-quinone oxidoreductase subunit NuoK [Chloroflexota bacterium]
MTLPLSAFLIVGAILFSLGAVGVLIRRNIIVVFLSVELMLQGAILNLGAFAVYNYDMAGYMLVLLTLTIAAAEAVVGLAILVALSRQISGFFVDRLQSLRG